MNSKIAPYLIALIAIVGFGVRAMHWYPILPDNIAIHFGTDGTPNNWSSKIEFIVIIGGLMVLLLGVFFGLSLILKKLPDSLINLPNKEYWLAGERRETTIATIGQFLNDIGSRTLLLLAVVFELTCRANMSPTQELDSSTFLIVFGMFLFGVVVAIVYLVKNFSIPNSPTLNS
jgi:uncharacterized membrane protein